MSGLLFGIAFARFRARDMMASLRASEQRYGRLFEQSLAGIYRTTPEGRILECSEALARLYGYESRQDLLDHSAVALHESAEYRQRFFEALREKGTLIAHESRARHKDGTLFWTLEHVSLLPGAPEIIEGTMVDISERKEAEEALRLSRERYRSVIESSRDGLFFFDLATRRVLESNPAFQRMLGYSAEELSAPGPLARAGRSGPDPAGAPQPRIDLLLTDVVLPGLNGRRLADLLSPERPSMKVVFASGYFDERGILEPGSDFIQKPFNPETLARSVRRALDRKSSPPD